MIQEKRILFIHQASQSTGELAQSLQLLCIRVYHATTEGGDARRHFIKLGIHISIPGFIISIQGHRMPRLIVVPERIAAGSVLRGRGQLKRRKLRVVPSLCSRLN